MLFLVPIQTMRGERFKLQIFEIYQYLIWTFSIGKKQLTWYELEFILTLAPLCAATRKCSEVLLRFGFLPTLASIYLNCTAKIKRELYCI